MTELFQPFDVAPGNVMDEITWSEQMRYYLGTGIMAVPWKDEVNELAVTATGGANRAVSVDSGSAHIQGAYYKNDAPMILYCDANTSAQSRADWLLLELKWGVGASIHAKVVAGVPGVLYPSGNGSLSGTPMPQLPLVQTYGALWQVPLAQINVSPGAAVINTADIRDARQFVSSGTAKSSTFVIASDVASPLIRANADAVIPAGSVHAEDIINYGIAQVATTGSFGGLYAGGGTVLLSEGIFKTSGPINMLGSTNLKGLGWGTRLYAQPAGGYFNVISLDGVNWCTIADMYIDGGGTPLSRGAIPAMPAADTCGIKIHDGAIDTIKNCYIRGCRNVGIWIDSVNAGTSSWGHRVEGNYITGSYHDGIWTTGSQGIYTNNQCVSNGLAGFCLEGVTGSIGASANIVNNNQFGFNYTSGIEIDAAAGLTVYRNIVSGNQFNSNGQAANNVYSQIFMRGALCKGNKVSGNNCWTEDGFTAYKPAYGIYVDTTCIDNIITDNEVWYAAYTTANNIKCTRAGSSNISPNWIRYNRSQCAAPNGSSYDA
jgi:hypothetical protein